MVAKESLGIFETSVLDKKLETIVVSV